MTELREAIKTADQRVTEKKRKAAVTEAEKVKKSQPTAPPMESQQQAPPQNGQLNAAKEAIQHASKAAFDGLQVKRKDKMI